MNTQSRLSKLGRLGIALIVALLMGVLPIVGNSPVQAASNGQQVRFQVEDNYTIVYLSVSGQNQYGEWVTWPVYTCSYATISTCPWELTTQGWWWVGDVTVSFTVVDRFWASGSEKYGTCVIRVAESTWFGNTATLTYSPSANTCRY